MSCSQKSKIKNFKDVARKIRIDCIKMISEAGSGHPGGSLSCVDLLTILFLNKIKRTPKNVLSKDRHRFVLSKGHAVPVLYALFAHLELLDKKELLNLRKINSALQGHPDFRRIPYVEASTGSLGQGLSIAQGMALAGQLDKHRFRVYCLIGDGEIQEGQIWEALMSAPKFKLDNLTVILDYNKSQIDGYTENIMNIEPLANKLRAFNWEVYSIDGHDYDEIIEVYDQINEIKNQPTFIIAHTVKGKGVSFMENQISWHGVAPNEEKTELAIQEILKS